MFLPTSKFNTLRYRKVFQSICFSASPATLWQLWPLFLHTVWLVLGELVFFSYCLSTGLRACFCSGTHQDGSPGCFACRCTRTIDSGNYLFMTDARVYYPVVSLASHYLTLPSPLLVSARVRKQALEERAPWFLKFPFFGPLMICPSHWKIFFFLIPGISQQFIPAVLPGFSKFIACQGSYWVFNFSLTDRSARLPSRTVLLGVVRLLVSFPVGCGVVMKNRQRILIRNGNLVR